MLTLRFITALFVVAAPLATAVKPWAGAGGPAVQSLSSFDEYATANSGHPTVPWTGDEMTVEFWIQSSTWSGSGETVLRWKDNNDPSNHYIVVYFESNGVFKFFYKPDTPAQSSSGAGNMGDNESKHFAVVLERTGTDSCVVRIYVNGVLDVSRNKDYWPWTLPDQELILGIFEARQSTYRPTCVLDELRIWNSARSQTQLQDNMNRVLDPNDEPELQLYVNFDEGAATSLSHQGSNDVGWSSAFSYTGSDLAADYTSTQLEVSLGYAIDTFTDISAPSDVTSAIDIPLLGGDLDGTSIQFVLDSIPPELDCGSTSTLSTSPMTCYPSGNLTSDTTLVLEYHVTSGGEDSLKTKAYVELTAFTNLPVIDGDDGDEDEDEDEDVSDDNGSDEGEEDESSSGGSLAAIAGAVGGVVLVTGLAFVAVTRRSSESESDSASSDSKAPLPGPRRKQGRQGKNPAQTVGHAIERLLEKFTVPQLNTHVLNLLAEGKIDAALALALKVEEEAVGGPVKDYLVAVENVGSCLDAAGHGEALGAVKMARRTTMGMKGKVKESQIQTTALARVRKEVAKTYGQRRRGRSPTKGGGRRGSPNKKRGRSPTKTRGRSPTKRGGRGASPSKHQRVHDDWDMEVVRASILAPKTVPIGEWMDKDPGADMVTLTSSMAPLI